MTNTFAELGLPEHLIAILERRDITSPFPIQAVTIPDVLAGRDVCGRAPTGSGKTLAFGLPIDRQARPGQAPSAAGPDPGADPRARRADHYRATASRQSVEPLDGIRLRGRRLRPADDVNSIRGSIWSSPARAVWKTSSIKATSTSATSISSSSTRPTAWPTWGFSPLCAVSSR